jgi:hypothetical protein
LLGRESRQRACVPGARGGARSFARRASDVAACRTRAGAPGSSRAVQGRVLRTGRCLLWGRARGRATATCPR